MLDTSTVFGRARPMTRGDVDRDPTGVAVPELDLAGTHGRSDLKAKRAHLPADRAAHVTARAGPSKAASSPSPVIFTSRPRYRAS